MTGYITGCDGTVERLPPLLSWDVCHGFCSPCDSFEVSFLYESEMLPALQKAVRFRAEHEGETVFFGVVDDVELSADEAGCTAVLRGRGLQALLLDTEADSADYFGAGVDFILARHVRPWGVTDIDTAGIGWSGVSLTVSSGESNWSVVERFAAFCLGVRPRFSRSGTLVLNGKSGGGTVKITAKTPVSAQTWTQERYGVIARATVKNRVLGTSVTVENPDFIALGGHSRRVVNVPRTVFYDAMRHTGTYQIARSNEGFRRCSVTVPVLFTAFPGDRAVLGDTPLGIGGEYLVWSTRCWADGQSAGTVLELAENT